MDRVVRHFDEERFRRMAIDETYGALGDFVCQISRRRLDGPRILAKTRRTARSPSSFTEPAFLAASPACAKMSNAATAVARSAAVPAPTVEGPLPSGSPGEPGRNYPYAAAVDLRASGWIEQEFFISGTANRYDTPALADGSVASSGHSYKTRVVVRRPATAARFNGTVLVEWLVVSSGGDMDDDWSQLHEHLMSAQAIGVQALKTWNAQRYGGLDVTAGGAIARDDLSQGSWT